LGSPIPSRRRPEAQTNTMKTNKPNPAANRIHMDILLPVCFYLAGCIFTAWGATLLPFPHLLVLIGLLCFAHAWRLSE
jgi:hypothetical protein